MATALATTTEAEWEALRAGCEAEFEEWQRADYDAREFEDFGNWLARKARWNAPNRYGEAMNWQERGLLSDPELVALSKGQREFARQHREGR